MRAPQPELLVVGQQAGGEILARVIRLLVGLAAHVEDQRLFAVAVLIEELVRVIEQDALGVDLARSGDARAALVLGGQRELRLLSVVQAAQAGGVEQHLGALFLDVFFRRRHDHALGHRLPERGRVLEGKTTAHQRIAPRHPRACRRASTTVAFVHQH